MPPQSRGSRFSTSKSTPNLAKLKSLPPDSPSRNALPVRPILPEDEEEKKSLSAFKNALLSPPLSASEDESVSSEEDRPTFSSSALLPELNQAPVMKRPILNPRAQSLYNQSSRSQSFIHSPVIFAPPFYNRPPTPLPPSPSLTSLLRPAFTASAAPSRPTTPDSSDTDANGLTRTIVAGVPIATAAAVAHSARTATAVPRASPKVPTYEYYGFVLYLGSSLAFAMYLLWSYTPTPFLHQLGIYYYPNRWWSLAVPAWLVTLIIYIYVALASYNTGYLTLSLGSLECFVDEKADVASLDRDGKVSDRRGRAREQAGKRRGASGGGRIDYRQGHQKSAFQPGARASSGPAAPMQAGKKRNSRDNREMLIGVAADYEIDWRTLWNEGTDAVMDVPVGGVCEILYGAGRDMGNVNNDQSSEEENEIIDAG